MGASLWSYVVAHDDVQRAFVKLREDVFARREYHGARSGSTFRSIEDLVDFQAEDGTHSILDMARVVDGHAPPMPTTEELGQRLLAAMLGTADTTYGTVFRMTDDELRACCGAARASHAPDLGKISIERGTGRWTAIYDDETPVSLWFGGVSGD
jgi:hypothetical protein